jgi:hypothetical protein
MNNVSLRPAAEPDKFSTALFAYAISVRAYLWERIADGNASFHSANYIAERRGLPRGRSLLNDRLDIAE